MPLQNTIRDRNEDLNEARLRRKELEQAERRRALELKEACDRAFDEADTDGSGELNPEEVRAFIQKLDNEDGVIDFTDEMYSQIVGFTLGEFPPPVSHSITREQMPNLLSSSRAYLSKREHVLKLLRKHDTDQSGDLDLHELLAVLYDISPKGVSVRAGDVLWLVGRCDMNGDKKLSLDELVPALYMWAELVPSLRVGHQVEDQETTASILDAISSGVSQDSSCSLTEVEDPLEVRLRERLHRLEGATVIKRGKLQSYARTVTMSKMVVDNWELAKADRMQKAASKKFVKDKSRKNTSRSTACVVS